MITLPASSTSATAWTPAYLNNLNPQIITVDAPVVACEYSSTNFECQVLFTGEDSHRDIWSYTFCLASGGTTCQKGLTALVDTEGWTDYPIGLTFNGPLTKGSFVAAVTQANPQGYISVMQKEYVDDS